MSLNKGLFPRFPSYLSLQNSCLIYLHGIKFWSLVHAEYQLIQQAMKI